MSRKRFLRKVNKKHNSLEDWQITSKTEGMNRAKRRHVCIDCRHFQTKIYKECPECGSKNRQYFMSEAEHKRGMLLLLRQHNGSIDRLKFQPRFDLKVGGKKITTYIADAEYYEDGEWVVEDTKPSNFIDKTSEIKMKLFEAIHGVTIRIPQRKSGNMSKAKAGKTLL